jgi:hypothetical protein
MRSLSALLSGKKYLLRSCSFQEIPRYPFGFAQGTSFGMTGNYLKHKGKEAASREHLDLSCSLLRLAASFPPISPKVLSSRIPKNRSLRRFVGMRDLLLRAGT